MITLGLPGPSREIIVEPVEAPTEAPQEVETPDREEVEA